MTTFPDAIALPEAVVRSGQCRFTILTPALVRLEWDPSEVFEYRPSFTFIHRRLPVPEYTLERQQGWLVIRTPCLELRYREGSGAFSADNLTIRLNDPATPVVWRPGAENPHNLGGTVRTLDNVSGATPLGPGFVSRDGWVLLDDSRTLLFDSNPSEGGQNPPWAVPRRPGDALDWYFFGHGHNYKQALRDYTLAAGRIPLPPRFVFGAWWSRYWAYSDAELRELVAQFRAHDVPLDVLVVDMDWHLDGWTGYTWNPKLFPDPEGFLRWCHDQGLRVTLNLHPHEGVGRHEAAFPEMAAAMGLDPDRTDRIPFSPADPRYMRAYFDILHRPWERRGVDFWWIDWQQGTESEMPGLDPLLWLNYLHWEDMARNPERGERRPLIFSRWGGPGNHRYQIGFSGDTHCNWESLAFQPYFTATAGNVCFPFWSHDIGGHKPGPVEGELYARWIQFAVFNPVLRTHTTKNPAAERRIWAFEPEVFDAARAAYHLRYALIPYIYTAARQVWDYAIPLCRPLYYEWPERDEAYRFGGEYLFGDDLLAAPVTVPRETTSRCAISRVWLPPGRWRHWFTGEELHGPGEYTVMTPLDQVPVWARAGSVIPMLPRSDRVPAAFERIILRVFPGEQGGGRMYEDDGETEGYQRGEFAVTDFRLKRETTVEGDDRYSLIISPATGDRRGVPQRRLWEVHLSDVLPPLGVRVNGIVLRRLPAGGREGGAEAGWWFEAQRWTAVVRWPDAPTDQSTEIQIETPVDREGVLSSGLRGRTALLAQLADRAGGAAPPQAVRLLDQLKRSPEDFARAMRDQWMLLALAFAEAPVPAEFRREAVMRMSGLALESRIKGVGDGRVCWRAGVTLLQPAGGLEAECTVKPPVGWETLRVPPSSRVPLDVNQPVLFESLFESRGVPQTAVLDAQITIHVQNRPFVVPLRETLAPSINAWRVIGPFDNPPEAGLDAVLPPERSLDFDAEYPGRNGLVRWRTLTRPLPEGSSPTGEFYVDLHAVFGERHENAAACAAAFLESPATLDAVLALGSDDGVAVWLNGEQVFEHDIGRPYVSREDRVAVRLRPGVNALLLKITQRGGDWGFAAHLETPEGRPETRVRVRLEP
ncbi:MAG: hypothetical protein Kow0059_06990 [Candidatus Sumerlaeia bacterium]